MRDSLSGAVIALPETPGSNVFLLQRTPRVEAGGVALDYVFIKRVIDIVVALSVLLLALPLLVMLCVIISGEGASPIFGHTRIGLNGRRFRCWKLRTMVPDAQARLAALLNSDVSARAEWEASQKLRRDPRITPLGRFLRASSLDELPQMVNILRGEMTLVGPRPIVEAEIARYGSRFRHYTAVPPGLTGLWQVSGRSEASYRRRVALDTLYVSRRSLKMDLTIMAATIPSVLMSRGAI